jgi:hypothetical protein
MLRREIVRLEPKRLQPFEKGFKKLHEGFPTPMPSDVLDFRSLVRRKKDSEGLIVPLPIQVSQLNVRISHLPSLAFRFASPCAFFRPGL